MILVFSQQLLDLTHRWWRPDIDVNDVYPWRLQFTFASNCIPQGILIRRQFQLPDPREPARSLTDLLTAIAALLVRRQPHNVPLLRSARTVHEGVAEEHRILESANCVVGTYTPGDWMILFEARFSLRTQQHQQRFPQATRSLLARVPSGVLSS